jgi:hypothetical protein
MLYYPSYPERYSRLFSQSLLGKRKRKQGAVQGKCVDEYDKIWFGTKGIKKLIVANGYADIMNETAALKLATKISSWPSTKASQNERNVTWAEKFDLDHLKLLLSPLANWVNLSRLMTTYDDVAPARRRAF